jgi:hypothetical protein
VVATVEPDVKAVRLDYTAPATAATVTISRTGPSGTPATVRGWQAAAVVGGAAVVARDFEAPIGVPLVYTATAHDAGGAAVGTQTATITVPADGCTDTWLTDLARAGNTTRVLLEALPEFEFPVPNSVHDVIARRDPIVSSDVAHTPEFELSFLTETLDQREQARAALGNGVTVLLRTPPDYGIGNLYFAVLGYAAQRIVPGATVPDRRFVVAGRQVSRPDPALYAPVGISTYGHVLAAFATYQALLDGRASYDAVLYDWSGDAATDIVPWLPTDV